MARREQRQLDTDVRLLAQDADHEIEDAGHVSEWYRATLEG
jgi:hypothetical protein